MAAVLTVLRAYRVAGRPLQLDSLGSFEDWSSWVRDALVWLGQADPVETMETVRENDLLLHDHVAVLTQWHNVFGNEEMPARVVIERVNELVAPTRSSFGCTPKPEYRYPDFFAALLLVSGKDGRLDSKRLGHWLAKVERRIVHGLRVVRGGTSAGTRKWRVEVVS